jgi:hypothetical protein
MMMGNCDDPSIKAEKNKREEKKVFCFVATPAVKRKE